MYGENRAVSLERLGLTFRIYVTRSAVSLLSGNAPGDLHHQFNELGLLVEVFSTEPVWK
jgi:hypothetical protein